jgi:aminopeptidase N
MLKGVDEVLAGREFSTPASYAEAFGQVLANSGADPAFAAEALSLPSEIYLAEQMEVVDPDAIHAVRVRLAGDLAALHRAELLAAYHTHATAGPYSPDAGSAGKRSLRNLCLAYLMELTTPEACDLAFRQFSAADNMTDSIAALAVLADFDCADRARTLQLFYERWQDEPLVVDKWLRTQSMSRLPCTLAEVKRLTAHPAYSMRNPNKVYALVGSFTGNHVRFHAADGSGYEFLADQIIALDALNPQVAARIARAFDRWKKVDAPRQQHARAALERIRGMPGLSREVFEIVDKGLQ